jgi:regulator of cell morphogenesis and NO signaling
MSALLSMTDRTVGELASAMPATIRVFETWKIDYCCGGRTSLSNACANAGRTIDDFIAAVEASTEAPEAAPNDWAVSTLAQIATDVIDRYHRYTREELQTLQTLAEKVLGVHGSRRPELAEVGTLVAALTADLLPHMLKEEQVLFPYVEQLEQASHGTRTAVTPFFGTVKNPVRMMMIEHERVGELLTRLRTVTDAYQPPKDACFSYRELYRRLNVFEATTHEHIHVENNIYFPRAVTLEERVGNASAAGEACGTSCCGGH